ncbi:MAG TPA: plasmid mobilization relaxosome protein MobC [Thermoanaerobaculia bacterium]|nr:plasmid mobilization relaxosome protein MobC [Thermoanaerobaculia bacterium]
MQILDSHAQLAGVGRATLLRRMVLRYRPRRSVAPAVNLAAVGELNAIGNNLNQLVKLLHQGRAPLGLQALLEELLANIRSLRRELLGLQSPGDRKAD